MGLTILIVDDDPAFRSLARTLLTARGYRVIGEAEGVDDGLAVATEMRPDAVLLDVNLRDGDGLELAGRLTREGGPRVLLTSSDATAAPERLVRRSGAVGFVAKEELARSALDAYLTR